MNPRETRAGPKSHAAIKIDSRSRSAFSLIDASRRIGIQTKTLAEHRIGCGVLIVSKFDSLLIELSDVIVIRYFRCFASSALSMHFLAGIYFFPHCLHIWAF